MKATVEVTDLGNALKSVSPHMGDPKDELPFLVRTRLEFGTENVTLSATNRYTIGRAIVSDWEPTGEIGILDLMPEQIAQIMAVFKPAKKDSDEPDQHITIEADGSEITVTDVSGLFPGTTLKLPRAATDETFPNIDVMLRAVMDKNLDDRDGAERLVVNFSMINLFGHAVRAYKHPLVLDVATEVSAVLVTVGESFIGALMPIRPGDEQTAEYAEWHRAWDRRLPVPTPRP